jgi:hypothetical protein
MDGSEPPSLDLQHFDTHLILFLVIIDIHVIGCLLYLFYPLTNKVAKGYSNATVRPSVTSL